LLGLVTVTEAEPLFSPQVVGVDEELNDTALEAATETLVTAVQPEFVTVTVYEPEDKPVMDAVVPVLLHR
jgi:hypothetical protein